MKASLFLLFALFAIAFCGKTYVKRAYQQQCSTFKCEKGGEECGSVDLQTYYVSTGCINADTQYCNVTQTGTGIEVGQCIDYATVGQSCQNRECGLGLSCPFTGLLDTATCVPRAQTNVTRYPGQPCGSSNVVCVYSGDGFSNENTCNNGRCKFNDDGASCTGENQCLHTSDCVISGLNGVCQPRFAAGSACIANLTESNEQCQTGLNCMPTLTTDGLAGVCRPVFSQREKNPCKDSYDCKDGVCSAPDGLVNNVYWGVCVDYRKTSTLNKRCADNTDCTPSNGETCVCENEEKSVCKNNFFEREYQKDIQKYESCEEQADLRCAGLEVKQRLKCYIDACKKDMCKLYKNNKKDGESEYFEQLITNIVGSGGGNVGCALVQACDASALFTSFPILVALAAFVLLLQ